MEFYFFLPVPFFAEHVFLAVTYGEKVFKGTFSYITNHARDVLFLRLFFVDGSFYTNLSR